MLSFGGSAERVWGCIGETAREKVSERARERECKRAGERESKPERAKGRESGRV